MKTKFLSIFMYLDIFQQNVGLKLNSKYRVSLTSGKIFSIFIIAFAFYNMIQSGMIKKKDPMVIQRNIDEINRPQINMDKDNFFFSFSLTDDYEIFKEDLTIFKFKVFEVIVSQGGNKYMEVDKKHELCKLEDFSMPSELFSKTIDLNETYCLSNKTYSLKGFWDEDVFREIVVRIDACKNSSESEIVCKPQENIRKFFDYKFFNVYYQQNSFDMTDYEKPFISKLKSYYVGVNMNASKILRLFLKKTTIITDNGWIFPEEETLESYAHDRFEVDSIVSDENLFFFNLISSETHAIYQRRYQKLFDLLANLGGIVTLLTLLCNFIVKLIFDWKINELVMRKLYLMKVKRKKVETKKKFFLFEILTRLFFRNKKSNEAEKFFEDPFQMTFFERLHLFFKKKQKFSEREQIYLKYINKSNQKLDLVKVIQKLEEIEKLKYVLLTEEQILAFNALNKKRLDLFESRKTNKFQIRDAKNVPDCKSIENYIKRAKRRTNTSLVDQRLLNLMEN